MNLIALNRFGTPTACVTRQKRPGHIHAAADLRPGSRPPWRRPTYSVGPSMALKGRSRLRRCAVAASAHSSDDASSSAWHELPAGSWSPFSAELLLAVSRLGHLERYREEIKMVYQPGGVLDLTRCGLLITNIFSPQLDHRPAFTQLEEMAASAALKTMQALGTPDDGSAHDCDTAVAAAGEDHSDGRNWFDGLDVSDPRHLNLAVQALGEVLFSEAGLSVNQADPFDPLNGSLADVLHSKRGNQWSLALIYSHVASALGLPCALVGSTDRVLVLVGHPPAAALLVDPSAAGCIYTYPATPSAGSASSSTESAAENASSRDLDDEWSRALQERLLGETRAATNDDHDASNTSSSSSSDRMSLDADTRSVFSEWVVDEDDGTAAAGSGGSDLWAELDNAAAADAAANNGWKLLYGPAALTPDGPSSSAHSGSGWVDVSQAAAAGEVGILHSPFAALAGSPFPSSTDEFSAGHDNDTDSTASAAGSVGNAASSGEGTEDLAGDGAASRVRSLSPEDLVRFGGLQPISGRMLLQQLLGGMKLALMMSGRLEELLMVLRYLRATDPFHLPDTRDEALTLMQLGRPEEAVPLLREYLAVGPGAPDVDMVAEVLLQAQLSMEISRNRARNNRGQ